MSPRKPRTARPSRLSLQSKLKHLEQENLDLREALETIADVLEEVGILEPEEELLENDPSNLIEPEEVGILNALDTEDTEKDNLPTKKSEE